MARKYQLSNQAARDLDGIADYLGARSVEAADRVLDELTNTFAMLAKYPEVGTTLDEIRPGLRAYVPSRPASNYSIFFYRSTDGVIISDVIHSSRDWLSMLARGER